MPANSLISVIIPCFQQGQFLEQALDSILKQKYSNWECLIIDDGSTDNTSGIGEKWAGKNSRFRYFFKTNEGVSAARNFGLSKSKGEYVQFLDADDYLLPNKLSSGYTVLSKNPDAEVVISNFSMFKEDPGKPLRPYCELKQEFFNLESIMYDWNFTFSIPIHCGFFRKKVFDKIIFPEQLSAQEDWLVWVEIFRSHKDAVFIDEPLVLYRIHPASRMQSKDIQNDQIKAMELLRIKLSSEEYQKFTEAIIKRYLKRSEALKRELILLKKKDYVAFGNFMRRVFTKFGLGVWAKQHFP